MNVHEIAQKRPIHKVFIVYGQCKEAMIWQPDVRFETRRY